MLVGSEHINEELKKFQDKYTALLKDIAYSKGPHL